MERAAQVRQRGGSPCGHARSTLGNLWGLGGRGRRTLRLTGGKVNAIAKPSTADLHGRRVSCIVLPLLPPEGWRPSPPDRPHRRLRGRFASGRGLGGALVGNEVRRPGLAPHARTGPPLQIRFLRAVELIAAPLEMLAARLPSSSTASPSGTTGHPPSLVTPARRIGRPLRSLFPRIEGRRRTVELFVFDDAFEPRLSELDIPLPQFVQNLLVAAIASRTRPSVASHRPSSSATSIGTR